MELPYIPYIYIYANLVVETEKFPNKPQPKLITCQFLDVTFFKRVALGRLFRIRLDCLSN